MANRTDEKAGLASLTGLGNGKRENEKKFAHEAEYISIGRCMEVIGFR